MNKGFTLGFNSYTD